jgi:hypothetical protein
MSARKVKSAARKKLDLRQHYNESKKWRWKLTPKQSKDLKIDLWNSFIESDLPGINDDDCSVLPRILPLSYFKTIEKSAHEICQAIFRLITLPEAEVLAIFPPGPMRDELIQNLKVLKHRPDRLIGSLRFDMAVVGEPTAKNPPKLLEINEIGYDGLSRYPYIQETMFRLRPKFQSHFKSFNTSEAEIKNMRRMGSSLARFQQEDYNWDEQLLWQTAQRKKFDLRLISPAQFRCTVDLEDNPLMTKASVKIKDHRLHIQDWQPDSYMISFALEPSDFHRAPDFYAQLVAKKVPQYAPFLTGLFASKAILAILSDPIIKNRFLSDCDLSNSILPAQMAPVSRSLALQCPGDFVIKHVDGYGGEQVFMDQELTRTLKKLPKNEWHEWVVQKRIRMNTIDIDGMLSRPRTTIADLGVFVQYDWSQGRFNHFEVGGFLSRATNTSWKVNVSSGGAQVGVIFDRRY